MRYDCLNKSRTWLQKRGSRMLDSEKSLALEYFNTKVTHVCHYQRVIGKVKHDSQKVLLRETLDLNIDKTVKQQNCYGHY